MSKTTGKRIIAWVLTMTMVFAIVGVMPVEVLADDYGDEAPYGYGYDYEPPYDDEDYEYPVELYAPFGLSVDSGGVLTWNEVENAVYYDVYVDWVAFNNGHGDYIASDIDVVRVDVPRINLSGFRVFGDVYSFYIRAYVRAIGDGEDFLDSGLSYGVSFETYGEYVLLPEEPGDEVGSDEDYPVVDEDTEQENEDVPNEPEMPGEPITPDDDYAVEPDYPVYVPEDGSTEEDDDYLPSVPDGDLEEDDAPGWFPSLPMMPKIPEYESIGVVPFAPGTYHIGDIAIINNMITNHGLNEISAQVDGSSLPNGWLWSEMVGFVDWSNEIPRRVTRLRLPFRGMTGSLDLTGLTSLERLYLSNNQLTSIDVSGLLNLQWLNASNNQLANINLNNLPYLEGLHVSDNQLIELDIEDLSSLSELWASNNQLTSLDLSSSVSLIEINANSNLLSSLNVDDLTLLARLWANSNQLESLNVSGLYSLTSLGVGSNQLIYLDVSNLDYLEFLNVSNNYMYSETNVIGFSNPPTFDFTFLPQNVSTNGVPNYYPSDTAVINAIIANNSLNATPAPMDGSYVPSDWNFATWSSDTPRRIIGLGFLGPLTGALDLRELTSLQQLDIQHTQIISLDVSGITTLNSLSLFANNLLIEVDVSGATMLTTINARGNLIANFNLNGLHSIESLDVAGNQLSSLNLDGLETLRWLSANHNHLTVLDVSQLPNLASLDVYYNDMLSPDAVNGWLNNFSSPSTVWDSGSFNFVFFPQRGDMDSNHYYGDLAIINTIITNNNLSYSLANPSEGVVPDDWTFLNNWSWTNPQRLIGLFLPGRGLTGSLDVSGLTSLHVLSVGQNELTSVNIDGLTYLQSLQVDRNHLTSLDVSSQTNMHTLWVQYNNMAFPNDVSGWQNLFDFVDTSSGFIFSPQRAEGQPTLPTVTLGSQVGTLTAGTAGSVAFSRACKNFGNYI